MQDPDLKCRHFGILWHFGIFAKKSNKKSNPISSDFIQFFPIFRLFLTFRLSDSIALMLTQHHQKLTGTNLNWPSTINYQLTNLNILTQYHQAQTIAVLN